jgi:hypothetical protein
LYGNDFDYIQYKEFNTVSETQDLCYNFTVNIAYCSYDKEKNSYKQENLIQSSNTEKEAPNVNILLHTGLYLKGNIINYAMVITNVEKLTGLRFCNKYNLKFRTSDTHRARFNKHCNYCDVKFHMKLKFNSFLAFVHHIMKNKAFQYTLVHKTDVKAYKHVSSYITYVFETMNKTHVDNSKLKLLK